MLPFGVTIPAAVPQRSEISDGLMNYPVLCGVVAFAISQKCFNSSHLFCCLSVEFNPKSQRKSITPILKKPYDIYFGCKVGDQYKSWAPRSCCSRCSWYLRGCLVVTHQSLPFAVPVVSREQKDHTDCYCCFTKINSHNSRSKHTIVYPNIPSALRPLEHDGSIPVPKPLQQWALHERAPNTIYPENESGPSCSIVDPDFAERTVHRLISQSELNDLVRHLNLSKIRAEHLLLVYREGICYRKVLKCLKGNASNHCLHFILRTAN